MSGKYPGPLVTTPPGDAFQDQSGRLHLGTYRIPLGLHRIPADQAGQSLAALRSGMVSAGRAETNRRPCETVHSLVVGHGVCLLFAMILNQARPGSVFMCFFPVSYLSGIAVTTT